MFLFLLILFVLSPIVLVLIWTLPQFIISFFQKPKLDKLWHPLHEKLPSINFDNLDKNEILINNIRDAKYLNNSEWKNEINWLHKKYNLEKLTSLKVFVDNYALLQNHAILIFEFSENTPLCVSFEIRKEEPYDFKAYNTFYNNFECFYIFGTKEDLIDVRTKIRKEKNTFIYDSNFSKDEIRQILISIGNDANNFRKFPKFYKILSRNCLTEIFKHFKNTNFKYTRMSFFNLKNLLEKNGFKKIC